MIRVLQITDNSSVIYFVHFFLPNRSSVGKEWGEGWICVEFVQ